MEHPAPHPGEAGPSGPPGGCCAERWLVNHTISDRPKVSDYAAQHLTDHVQNYCGDLPVMGVRKFRRDWIVEKKRGDDYQSNGRKSGAVITKFSNRSRNRLLHMAKNCNLDFCSMLTITYPKEFPREGPEVKEDLSSFKKFLRRNFPGIAGLWFLEFQKRGAPHFHFLLNLNLSGSGGELRTKIRTRLHKSHTSTQYQTHQATEDKASAAWFRIVASGDEKHLRAGVCWEVLESESAALRYAAKHAAKPHQKSVPDGFINVGRFWGKIGEVHLVGGEDLEVMSTEDVFKAYGPGAISTNGRIKKYLYDANGNVSGSPGEGESN